MVLFSIVYNAKHACAVFRALVLSRVSGIISRHHCFRLRDALCVVSPAPIGYYLSPGSRSMCVDLCSRIGGELGFAQKSLEHSALQLTSQFPAQADSYSMHR